MNVLAHLRVPGPFGESTSLVITGDGGMPCVAYWGADLGDAEVDARVFGRMLPGGALDVNAPLGIVTEASRGYMGLPGIECARDGEVLLPRFVLESFSGDELSSRFVLNDLVAHLRLEIVVNAVAGRGVTVGAALVNMGSAPVVLSALRLSVPVGSHAREVLTLGGRHAMENVPQRTPWERNTLVASSRSGRTGHEQQNVVFAGTTSFGEQHGEVWGAHLAWSGNFEMVCDGITDTRRSLYAGEALVPGEVVLESGDSYCTPQLVLAHSAHGLSPVSMQFHEQVRSIVPPRGGVRPVHLNTWEAVYFNHNLTTLKQLADVAAQVGIERFVLDDGWFHDRRNDQAGLGDWWIDPTVWPDGLTPLVSHVRSQGMEFGIWFEPEMANPNSDLFRNHPEWVLNDERYPTVLGRNQLVLNMALPEVRRYLYEAISEVLSRHDITYVKWDHNRPLIGGQAHAQTLGTYELLDRLVTRFPHVEFESCASGGGRVDMGIAPYVQRFWTSDNIDALDRVQIQRGFSMLMPANVMGAHVGGPVCHTTGRRHTMGFRAATAMFGWMGVEWNILDASDRDRSRLTELIALHKMHRELLHNGVSFRMDHPDANVVAHGVVSREGDEALVNVTRVANGPDMRTSPVRIPYLDASSVYEIQIALAPSAYALHRAHPAWMASESRLKMSGAQLARVGLEMPALQPESALVLHLTRVGLVK